jgi:hypothetical protein
MNRPRLADAASLRAKLDAGTWLKPAEVGVLFGVTRWAIIDWIKAGRIGVRRLPSGYRLCDPDDVKRLLNEYEQVHRGDDVPGDPAG